ncbi:MAG: TIGR02757 family protein [Treponema sp.]|nr:TIGR02757 family protein [Treponema sp.]
MDKKLIQKIRSLADKYETPFFLEKDPSLFMHRYSDINNQELSAFIAANLAFGRRDQILKHVDFIHEKAGKNLYDWILNGDYRKVFDSSESSFYRMYSFNAMRLFFDSLRKILKQSGSLGEHFKELYLNNGGKNDVHLCNIIASCFPKECVLIPYTKTSACKKLNMFLRWMVRDNSPVDLGLWKWFSKKDLLIPMDTHVLQTAADFNLIEKTSSGKIPGATIKMARTLTQKMKEVFPEDPCRADFALFGLGVES